AQSGAVGVVRRDPMAMKPFCGYNFGNYWSHWLEMGKRVPNMPKIFHVNWFRQDENGKFMWPGFGDNMRVLDWILERCRGNAPAVETPIGYLPAENSLNITGLDIDDSIVNRLCAVDPQAWLNEIGEIETYLQSFGDQLPEALQHEVSKVRDDLQAASG
ncbi:MAG: phosphoenolpyruvate carboxykinase domain-containing protein, partial [Gammaproteobacteria bacterium]